MMIPGITNWLKHDNNHPGCYIIYILINFKKIEKSRQIKQYLKLISFILVSPRTHQEEGSWGNQTQIHRHFLQDGSWSFPNQEGQNGLYGTSQEGCRQGRGCCLNLNIWLCFCFGEIKKSIENIFFALLYFGFTWVKLQR